MFDWIVGSIRDYARQNKSVARNVRDDHKDAGAVIIGVEGEESGDWVLVDAGDIVTHVMQPAVRQYYNLEELWGDGKFDKAVNSTAPVKVARRGTRGARKTPSKTRRRSS